MSNNSNKVVGMKTTITTLQTSTLCALLIEQGYDVDKIVASINCAFGRAQSDGSKTTAAKGKILTKTNFGVIPENTKTEFVSDEIAFKFYIYLGQLATLMKQYGFLDRMPIPTMFGNWLEKHRKEATPTPAVKPEEKKQSEPMLAQ